MKINELEKAKEMNSRVNNISYANVVSNSTKEKKNDNRFENKIIIKKKIENDQIDIKSELFKNLEPIKKKITIKNIKVNEKSVIVNAFDVNQQDLIVKQLEENDKLEAFKPKVLIPAILFKEIDKKMSNEEFKASLAESLNIDINQINIKTTINNEKFRTKRIIAQLSQDTTKMIIEEGYVKLDYMINPIEPTFKFFQCNNCYKFGHYHKNIDGTVKCKNKRVCAYCTSEENESHECSSKNDISKRKCVNCKGNHSAFDKKYIKRKDAYDELKARFKC